MPTVKRLDVDTTYINSIVGHLREAEIAYKLSVSVNTIYMLRRQGKVSERVLRRFCEVYEADYEKCLGAKEDTPITTIEEQPADTVVVPDPVIPSDDINLLINKVVELQEVVNTFNDQMKKIDDALTLIGRCIADGNEQARKYYINTNKFFTDYRNQKKFGTW